MNARKLARAAAAVAVTGAIAVGATSAPAADVAPAGATTITYRGVGGVKIGRTYTDLRKRNLIGKLIQGCELAGPNARSAVLKKPLVGSVDFSFSSPRKVETITLAGGATAKGVGVGDKIAAIKAKFPHAVVDHSTDSVFELTIVRVPKADGGKFEFGVDTHTKKVSAIGIPTIAFCE
jgi:hypothetical protein